MGPEIIAAAWYTHGSIIGQIAPFFVVGGSPTLERAFRRNHGADKWLTAQISEPAEAAEAFGDYLPVLDLGDALFEPGQPNNEAAAVALRSLETATGLVKSGLAAALVTGPVSKDQLAKIGFAFPGQTEFVASQCEAAAADAVMMLAGPQLRTVPMTVHCALADVPGKLSVELVVRRSRIVDRALKQDFGIAAPRLAICGLNPHAGENGRMGHEEIEIIAPAIAALQAEGIDATGPHPADTLFAPRARAKYDVAIAMYHDQALIPLKALDFDQGVNVTLGLPIVRTSPDHGTAFDIAGQGIADPGAMIAAIRMAGEIAARRAAAV